MNGFVSTSACGKRSFSDFTSQHSTGTPENVCWQIILFDHIACFLLLVSYSWDSFSKAHESRFSQDLVTGNNRYEHADPALWRDRCWGWVWWTNGGGSEGVFWILQHHFTSQLMTVWAGLTAALVSAVVQKLEKRRHLKRWICTGALETSWRLG